MNVKAMKTIGKGCNGLEVIGVPVCGSGSGGSGGGGTGGAVASVNGKTGEVVLDAEDVGAYVKADTGIPATDLESSVQTALTEVDAFVNGRVVIVADHTAVASPEEGVVYREQGTDSYTDYMYDGTAWKELATFDVSVYEVYDISANNSNTAYDNFKAALGTSGANIPQGIRTGGMSVKYLENVYADYDVVVTEGLTTEPTGTELESAPSITSGTYKASQLSAFSTLPANPYNSVTYYIGVTADETTTYTSWVITKKTNDSTKYVQCRLMASAWSANVDDWQIDVMHELEAQAGEAEEISIPFDGGNKYIKKSSNEGDIASNNNWRITKPIPVNEGEEWYYSGRTGTTAVAVAGYLYDGTNYTYKVTLAPSTGNSQANNLYIYIPKGITHMYACCSYTYLADAKLVRTKYSTLSKLVEDLGEINTVERKTGWTLGNYVTDRGTWESSTSRHYLMFDVRVGDVIEMNRFTTGTNTAEIAKKLTASSFKVLVNLNDGYYEKYSYVVKEDMTVCLSLRLTPDSTLVRHNRLDAMDIGIKALQDRQVADEANQVWLAQYDLKFGYMFNGIAVIGDSMSVGSISTEETEAPNSNDGASWLSVLAKRWGCISRQHYAKGGTSAYQWLNDSGIYGLGKMLADTNIYNAYFIAYGHNDTQTTGAATDTAATVTISGTTPSCASGNSFCAYYKAVIDQIRTKAPHAMIFCLSEYDDVTMTKSNGVYSQAIKDVAAWYYEQGDHLVYALNTGGVSNAVSDMSLGTHYSTQGYHYIAMRVDQEANKVIYANRSDIQLKEFGIYNNENVGYMKYDITT